MKTMTIKELAERLGRNRSNLHKKIKREGVKVIKIPMHTGGGLQMVSAVPFEYAEKLIKTYEEANRQG